MPHLGVSIKENGDLYIIIYASDGSPLTEFSEAQWKATMKRSYNLLHEAYRQRDQLRQSGKLDKDPFYFALGEDNVLYKRPM